MGQVGVILYKTSFILHKNFDLEDIYKVNVRIIFK